VNGTLVTHSGKSYSSPEHLVAELFDDVPNGKMTFPIYKEVAQKNPDIFECLKLNSSGLCTDVDPFKTRPK